MSLPSASLVIVAVPSAGVVTTVTVRSSPSASVSLARTGISTAVTNGVSAVSSTATGALLIDTSTDSVDDQRPQLPVPAQARTW